MKRLLNRKKAVYTRKKEGMNELKKKLERFSTGIKKVCYFLEIYQDKHTVKSIKCRCNKSQITDHKTKISPITHYISDIILNFHKHLILRTI